MISFRILNLCVHRKDETTLTIKLSKESKYLQTDLNTTSKFQNIIKDLLEEENNKANEYELIHMLFIGENLEYTTTEFGPHQLLRESPKFDEAQECVRIALDRVKHIYLEDY